MIGDITTDNQNRVLEEVDGFLTVRDLRTGRDMRGITVLCWKIYDDMTEYKKVKRNA